MAWRSGRQLEGLDRLGQQLVGDGDAVVRPRRRSRSRGRPRGAWIVSRPSGGWTCRSAERAWACGPRPGRGRRGRHHAAAPRDGRRQSSSKESERRTPSSVSALAASHSATSGLPRAPSTTAGMRLPRRPVGRGARPRAARSARAGNGSGARGATTSGSSASRSASARDGVAAMQHVGLVADDEADRERAADRPERLDEAARGRVGEVEVLEDEEHDAVIGQPLEAARGPTRRPGRPAGRAP